MSKWLERELMIASGYVGEEGFFFSFLRGSMCAYLHHLAGMALFFYCGIWLCLFIANLMMECWDEAEMSYERKG